MVNKSQVFSEFIQVLKDIEEGKVTITYQEVNRSSDLYLDENFITSNGWKFSFFDDNGSWDYLTSITSPTGDFCGYKDIGEWDESLGDGQDENRIELMNYQPPSHIWESIYVPILTKVFYDRMTRRN